jgi:hypothetical protein
MFTRKIIAKLMTLSLMLFSLGFAVTAGAEKAPTTVCRACIQGFPGYPKGIWRYCQWEVPTGTTCPAAPPSDDYCIFANPYCDPI